VRLVAERTRLEPGASVWIGLHQRIEKGWHTYWRNPGDSGQATAIEWTLPDGVEVGEIRWPMPKRIPAFGQMNYGYEGEVLLPIRLSISERAQVGETLRIEGEVSWVACKDVCIPGRARVELVVIVGTEGGAADQWAAKVARAVKELPRPFPTPIRYRADSDSLRLVIDRIHLPIEDPQNVSSWDLSVFPYEWGVLDHASEQRRSLRENEVVLSLVRGDLPVETLADLSGILVFRLKSQADVRYLSYEFTAKRSIEE
jgi:thiol:disulfide interchange protein DsbD